MTEYQRYIESKSQAGADSGFEPIWLPEETEHAQRPKRFSPLPTAGLAAMNLAVGLGSAAVTELFAMGMGLFCG